MEIGIRIEREQRSVTGKFIFQLHLDLISRPGVLLTAGVAKRNVEIINFDDGAADGFSGGGGYGRMEGVARGGPDQTLLQFGGIGEFGADFREITS